MERIVIVAYKPLPGKEKELEQLVKGHWDKLNGEGLVSDRTPVIARATDGSVIEVFGWKSEEAIEAAHSNAVVQNLWAEFAKVCEYIPVGSVSESDNLFSEFTPI